MALPIQELFNWIESINEVEAEDREGGSNSVNRFPIKQDSSGGGSEKRVVSIKIPAAFGEL